MNGSVRKRERKIEHDPPPHDPVWRDATWRSRVRQRLLGWFAKHARDLPWREDSSAYRVWVSEIMLQQTQVATVIPYFERFLNEFPTIAELASADEQSLLNLWEGLGYYRRARSLHAAAKKIVEQHQGVFPETYDEVVALPGIGRYTAGAILSISRDARLPILEGNTHRVFSRWVASRGSAGDTSTSKLLWQISEAMLPRQRSGTFNQAAMELGALVCTPKVPGCDACPVRAYCCARREGLQNEIPGKVSRVEYEDRTEFALVISEEGSENAAGEQPRYLLRPLPEGGRWAGLWDFPRTTQESLDSVTQAASELEKRLGVPVSAGDRLETIRHAVTKYRICLHVHQASLAARMQPCRPWRFVSAADMKKLPMSVTGRRIAEKLLQGNDR